MNSVVDVSQRPGAPRFVQPHGAVLSLVAAEGAAHGLWDALRERAGRQPADVALRYKQRGLWRGASWSGWFAGASRMALVLKRCGARAGDRVAIVLPDAPVWFEAAMAVVALGATLVPVPSDVSRATVIDLMASVEGRFLLTLRADLLDVPGLTTVSPDTSMNTLTPADSVEREGPLTAAAIAWSDSGAAELLSEGQLTQAARGLAESAGGDRPGHLVSALPASSAMGLAARLALPFVSQRVVCLAEPGVTFFDTLADVEPDAVLASQLEWEQLWREVAQRRLEATPLHRWLFDMATRGNKAPNVWSPQGLIAANLRSQLGLRHCRHAVSAQGPVSENARSFYTALGIGFSQIDMPTDATPDTAPRNPRPDPSTSEKETP
ncbi:MAG: AMP-binding protein [Rhizobacter sp.]|nr:AMP-binding protein [Rhizobacter sp.]